MTDEQFGFSNATTGAHMARSMMLDELTLVLKATREEASREAIRRAVVDENLLGKPTGSSRLKTYQQLVKLYTLDTNKVLFRTLRKFAAMEPGAVPLLALVLAYSRDAQLRGSFELISGLKPGETLPRVRMEEFMEDSFPNRFSKAMKASLARNVNTSWTKTGHLNGIMVKTRNRPRSHWLATTYALFTGYLAGVRGIGLLDSNYARLVGADPMTAADHLATAGAHGLMRFRNAGGVVETDFTNLLQPAEQVMLHGAH